MKKTLLLLLIVSSFKLIAQHPDLQQGNWYIQNITINNATTVIPSNPINFPYAYLMFFNTTSGLIGSENNNLANCNIAFVGHVNYSGTNLFNFLDFTPSQIISGCSTSLIDFMNLHVGFYNNEITENFTYTITTETDNSKTLIVSNNNGDTVVYTNTFFNLAPQELTDNNWYLHNLIIDGNDNIPPNNTELSEITLDFDGAVSTSACSGFIGYSHFDYTLLQFYFYDISTNYGLTLCDTDYPESNTFTDLYIRDFYLNNLPGAFSYEHTIDGNNKTLTITNSLGNQAVYGNFTLSNQEFISSKFSVYPNPVCNNLTIKESSNNLTQILNISIYNSLGLEIIKTNNKNINMSNLANGIYLLKIKLEDNIYFIKKIIKK